MPERSGAGHPVDRQMVESLRDGDQQALGHMYDAYAARLFDYSRGMLGDTDSASDVVQDTFVAAQIHIGQLRDPDRLRPWLYAIARRECLRQIRARAKSAGLDESAVLRDETVDLDARLRREETRTLVMAALDGLAARDREVLNLALRHELAGADLADALGVSRNHAHALLSRARTQFEKSLAVVVLIRTGRQECDELATIVGDWDESTPLTPLLRKRVARHIDNCEICGESRRRRVSAAALLGVLPIAMLPSMLRHRVLGSVTNPELVAYRERVTDNTSEFGRNGFPVQPDGRNWLDWKIGASTAVAALAVVLAAILFQQFHGSPAGLAGPARHPASSAPQAAFSPSPFGSSATGTPAPTARPSTSNTTPPFITQSPTLGQMLRTTASPSSSPTHPKTPPPTRSPKPPPPPPPPGQLSVTPTSLQLAPGQSGTVTLSAGGGPVSWTGDPVALTLSPSSGQLASGASVSVQITVSSTPPSGVCSETASFTNGATKKVEATVTVNWCSPT